MVIVVIVIYHFISSDTVNSCVVSDNTTSISSSYNDDSCVAGGNCNTSNFNSYKNNNICVARGNACSSDGNSSDIISNIASTVIPDDNDPTNDNDKMDVSNFNDNISNLNNDSDGNITLGDVVAVLAQ